MESYHLVLLNLVLLFSSVIIANTLADLYPGKVNVSVTVKGDVAEVEVRRRFRAFIQSVYVLAISFFIDALDLLAEKAAVSLNMDASWVHLLTLEKHYINAWVIFWSAAVLLCFFEWRLRARYQKSEKLFPVSPLITFILRWSLLIALALWIAHFVLGWPSHHILISTAALAAFGLIVMKSTLGDLLSGVSLHISRSVLPSQWIDIPDMPIQGEVISTNWRETRIRSTDGHMHIVPNSLIAAKPFHNMTWPHPLRRHSLNIYLKPDHSFKEVEQILLAATEGLPKVRQKPKPPQVIIKAFLEFGVHYQIRFWSTTFHDRSSLENEVYVKALTGLQKNNIELAYTLGALAKRDGV